MKKENSHLYALFKKTTFSIIFGLRPRLSFLLMLILPLISLLQSCNSSTSQNRKAEFEEWTQNNDKIKVLSTTNMISDLVKQVGGEYVNNLTLIQGELDPHSYQLVKGDDEKLAYAQLIFYNGLGLEHGPSLYNHLIANKKAIPLGDLLNDRHSDAVIYVSGQRDPHIWMDISLWSYLVPIIVEVLSQQDPIHAQEFVENGKKLQAEMSKTNEEVYALLHRIPEKNRYLVTSHDAFNYFARAYLTEEGERESGTWRKRFAAPEGLAPESQLSSADIKAIIDHLKEYQIHLIFPETNVSRDSIRKIIQASKEQGIDVHIACCPLYGDAMGPPGSEADTYLKMIYHNAKMLSEEMALNHQQTKN
jgi:manganese/zinc/iron transport system substrate-binding protein